MTKLPKNKPWAIVVGCSGFVFPTKSFRFGEHHEGLRDPDLLPASHQKNVINPNTNSKGESPGCFEAGFLKAGF